MIRFFMALLVMQYIIVTGPKNAGKSCCLLKTAEKLKASATLGGVITMRYRICETGESDNREIVMPGGAETVPFCSRIEWDTGIPGDVFLNCHFYFSKSAFAKGNEWIRAGLGCDVLFIDEIGGLEMAEESEYKWDFTFPLAQTGVKKQTLLFSVKEKLVDEFINKYNYGWKIFRTEAGRDISDRVLSEINP
jgi:nucleoside-triphosphatase THEP1